MQLYSHALTCSYSHQNETHHMHIFTFWCRFVDWKVRQRADGKAGSPVLSHVLQHIVGVAKLN
eukprot:3516146-Amphidinium_carterae.2